MVAFGIDPAAREVKTVYLLRMGNGLDQYLASELSKQGVYTVTTDPQRADALFTDALGEGFEKKLNELYAPAQVEQKEKGKDDEGEKAGALPDLPKVGASAFGRSRGTIFLVERKSRNVLWSVNRQPRHFGSEEMSRHAYKLVVELKKELSGSTPK